MTFLEVIGFCWIAFTCALGNVIVFRSAYRGAKQQFESERVDRVEQRAFERKVMP